MQDGEPAQPMALRASHGDALRTHADNDHPPGLERFFPSAEAQPMALAVAIFLLAAIVIGWPWLAGGVTHPEDAEEPFQPALQIFAQSLARGETSVLAPFLFSGPPHIGDPQSMYLSH